MAAAGPSPSRSFAEIEATAAWQQDCEASTPQHDLEEINHHVMVFSSTNASKRKLNNMPVKGRIGFIHRRQVEVDRILRRLQDMLGVLNVSPSYVWYYSSTILARLILVVCAGEGGGDGVDSVPPNPSSVPPYFSLFRRLLFQHFFVPGT